MTEREMVRRREMDDEGNLKDITETIRKKCGKRRENKKEKTENERNKQGEREKQKKEKKIYKITDQKEGLNGREGEK